MCLDVNGTVVDRLIFSCDFFYLPLVVQPQVGPRKKDLAMKINIQIILPLFVASMNEALTF